MLGLVGWDVGFLWFSIDVLSWRQLAGLRVNLDATRHLLDACRTRGKAFVVHGGCPGFCVSDISYLEGKQSCACWPTFDMSTMPPSDPPFMSVSFCSLPKSV